MRPASPPALWTSQHFNPRTHVGCDPLREHHPHEIDISIHAPTWGATSDRGGLLHRRGNFNPRTHVGCDPGHQGLLLSDAAISIHAPTWGATDLNPAYREKLEFQSTHPRGVRQLVTDGRANEYLFQSTHPRGVRRVRAEVQDAMSGFQSTHPRGVRLVRGYTPEDIENFNPRTHVGCDEVLLCHYRVGDISIHAPTWGATPSRTAAVRRSNFNPRTHVGCDRPVEDA